MTPITEAQLFFGRNIGARPGVTDEDWRDFLDREVATRFPDGFTAEDATGQWKDSSGDVVREHSKRLTFVFQDDGENAKLSALREAYKRRFHQQSVLMVETRACGSF